MDSILIHLPAFTGSRLLGHQEKLLLTAMLMRCVRLIARAKQSLLVLLAAQQRHKAIHAGHTALCILGNTRLVNMCMGPTSIEGLDSWPNRHERARHHMRSLL